MPRAEDRSTWPKENNLKPDQKPKKQEFSHQRHTGGMMAHGLHHNQYRRFFFDSVLLRRSTLVCIDAVLILAAFYGSFALRLHEQETLVAAMHATKILPWLALATGLPILLATGWYQGLTRYAGSHSLYGLLPRAVIMVMALLMANTLFGGSQPPRSFWILYWLLLSGLAIASRIVLRDILITQLDRRKLKKNSPSSQADATLIYGAGFSGMNLLNALRNDGRFRVIGFLDDDEQLHGRTLQNIKIHSPVRLSHLITDQNVTKVLLALPSVSRQRKRLLVDQLTKLGLEVLSIPSLSQLANGQRIVSDIQPVRIEDLLGREPSVPEPVLLQASVKGKSVLVTGAGGSIGSELCRQVLELEASSILLLDLNEYALYTIEKELRSISSATRITAILGDCGNAKRLADLCQAH